MAEEKNEKGSLYLEKLESAREDGRYGEFPALVKKLEKHDQSKRLLCRIALAEVTLACYPPEGFDDEMNGHLEAIIKDLGENEQHGSIEEQLQAQVLRMHIHWLRREFKDVIDTTVQIEMLPRHVGLKYATLRGLSLEALDENKMAATAYREAAADLEHSRLPREIVIWSEILLHRLAMQSSLVEVEESGVLQVFRTYSHVTSMMPKEAGMEKKKSLQRRYLLYLSDILAKSPTKDILQETHKVESAYEQLLLHTTEFPKAQESNAELTEYVEILFQNWEHAGRIRADTQRVIDSLYRAAKKTFHSLIILRYLSIVLTSAHQYTDALRAFETWLELMQRLQLKASKGAVNRDSLDSESVNVTACCNGMRLLSKFLRDGRRALEVATILQGWLEEWKFEEPRARSCGWRSIGIAHSLWSNQTYNSEERDVERQKAIVAYHKSIESLPRDASSLYHLSRVLAESRKLDEALTAIRDSLRVDKKSVHSWHLLALILSAKQEPELAIHACANAIDINFHTRQLSFETRKSLIDTSISHLHLTEYTQGVDTAINRIEGLLEYYKKIFGDVGLRSRTGEHNTGLIDDESREKPSAELDKANGGQHIKSDSMHQSLPSRGSTKETKEYSVNGEVPISESKGLSNGAFNHLLYDDQVQIAKKSLMQIWLTSAELFRKAEKFEDAENAINEAGNVVPGELAIAVARAWLAFDQKDFAKAETLFDDVLFYDLDNPEAIVGLTRTLLALPEARQPDATIRAEFLLSTFTRLGVGWDSAEAWSQLADCFELSGQDQRAEESLWWVLRLEETRPIRQWSACTPEIK